MSSMTNVKISKPQKLESVQSKTEFATTERHNRYFVKKISVKNYY